MIATYNRSEVLRFALASALRQTYRDIEVLVIGDACSDDSEHVARSFGDPRVRWVNLPENSGSQAGPNQAGLEMARGPLVAYLGQDDLWRPDHLALLVGRWQATGAELVSGVCEHVWPGRLGAVRFRSGELGATVSPTSLMHEVEVARRAGGWRDHRTIVLPPDLDFVARLLEQGARHSRVRALSVVKLASVLRPGSYVQRRSDEQERWARRIGRRSFVAQEVARGVLLMPLRPASRQVRLDLSAPGSAIRQLRRIRGLD